MTVVGQRKILSILLNTRTMWEPGWTHAAFAPVSGGSRLLIYSSVTGSLQSRRVTGGGYVDGLGSDMEFEVGAGFSAMETFAVNGAPFVMLVNRDDGTVRVHPVAAASTPDTPVGQVGDPTYVNTWSAGWTTATAYVVGGATFMLLLKESTGDIHIHRMEPDGAVGARVQDISWSPGWTTVRPVMIGPATYLLFLQQSTGQVRVHRANADGTIGPEVDRRDWSSGWTTAEFFVSGGNPFLFLLKEATGDVHVHEIAGDGTVGAEVDRRDWSSGWTTVRFYRAGSTTCLFLLKESDGAGHLHRMGGDGTVGDRINVDEPRPREGYLPFMTEAGIGQRLLADYIADQSEGRLDIAESQVVGWLTHPGSWQELKTRGRDAQIRAGIDAARAAGVDVDDFDHFVVFHNRGPEAGSSASGVLVRPGRESLEFVAHELFHGFGLGHSFSNDPNSLGAAWESVGEYDDEYDVMSAERSTGYVDGDYGERGPNLNAYGRSLLGWLDDDDVETYRTDRLIADTPVAVRIAGLNSGGPGPRVVRLYGRGGDYLSMEHRPSVDWDQALTGRPLIHHVATANNLKDDEIDRRNWSAGWTSVAPYRVGGDAFVLLLKESDGSVSIRQIEDRGRFGAEVQRTSWSPGWTTVETFVQSGVTYLFLLKESTGDVHIHEMNADGTVGKRADTRTWSAGWTTAEFFAHHDTVFVLLLKQADGTVHVHRMSSGGRVGPRIDTRDWSSGWTAARVFQSGAKRFLLVVKAATGDAHVHEMNADGTIGSRIYDETWAKSQHTVEIVGENPTRLLRGSDTKADDGTTSAAYTLVTVGDDGQIPEATKTRTWSTGWDSMKVATTPLGRFLIGVKSSTGEAFSRRISSPFLIRDLSVPANPPVASAATLDDVDVDVVDEGATALVTMRRRFR